MRYNLSSRYTCEDINRVEAKTKELWDLIYAVNPNITSITEKTDWDYLDIPLLLDIDRVKNNIMLLPAHYIKPSQFPNLLLGERIFNFVVANKLEVALELMEEIIDKAELRFSNEGYSGDTIWL
jgi:hypothetical protein